MPSVFFLGATGYIGGSVLVALRRQHPDWPVTALVRNEEHIESIRTLGVTVLRGSFADKILIIEQARKADYVVNVADSRNVPLIMLIYYGMRQRYVEGVGKGTLFHMSGLEVFLDGKREGKFDPEGRIWDDASQYDIKSITTSMPHGNVDFSILKAGEAGYFSTYILCPGLVLGPSNGPVKTLNSFVKLVVPLFLNVQNGVCVGEGTNELPLVYVDDVADYFLRVMDLAYTGWDAGAGPYERYFMVAACMASWKDIAGAVSDTLHQRGLLKDGVPLSVPPYGGLARRLGFFSENVRIVAERGKALGWGPRRVNLSNCIDETVDDVLDYTLIH